MLEAETPPKVRAPAPPLNVVVAAAWAPARTRNVVALVVPLTMVWVNLTLLGVLLNLETVTGAAAKALAVAS